MWGRTKTVEHSVLRIMLKIVSHVEFWCSAKAQEQFGHKLFTYLETILTLLHWYRIFCGNDDVFEPCLNCSELQVKFCGCRRTYTIYMFTYLLISVYEPALKSTKWSKNKGDHGMKSFIVMNWLSAGVQLHVCRKGGIGRKGTSSD